MPMTAEIPYGLALALAAAIFAAGGVQASGAFPLRARPERLRGQAGALALAMLALALALLLAAAVRFAAALLSWPVAIIAAGLGLLAGPLLWQRAASTLADRPPGFFAGAALALLAAAGLTLWTGAARS